MDHKGLGAGAANTWDDLPPECAYDLFKNNANQKPIIAKKAGVEKVVMICSNPRPRGGAKRRSGEHPGANRGADLQSLIN